MVVICLEGYFETGGERFFVEVPEHTEGHFDVGLLLQAVEAAQKYLLGDFDFGVALPTVPHALRAVENDKNAGLVGCGSGFLCVGNASAGT